MERDLGETKTFPISVAYHQDFQSFAEPQHGLAIGGRIWYRGWVIATSRFLKRALLMLALLSMPSYLGAAYGRGPCEYGNDVHLLGPENGLPVARFWRVLENHERGRLQFAEILICERAGGQGSYVIVTDSFPRATIRNPPQEVLAVVLPTSGEFWGRDPLRIYLNDGYRGSESASVKSETALVTQIQSNSRIGAFIWSSGEWAGMPLLKGVLTHRTVYGAGGAVDLGRLSVLPNGFVPPSDYAKPCLNYLVD